MLHHHTLTMKERENKLEIAGILLYFILSAALFTRDIRSFQRPILPSYMELDAAKFLRMDIGLFLIIERALLFVLPLVVALTRQKDADTNEDHIAVLELPVDVTMPMDVSAVI